VTTTYVPPRRRIPGLHHLREAYGGRGLIGLRREIAVKAGGDHAQEVPAPAAGDNSRGADPDQSVGFQFGELLVGGREIRPEIDPIRWPAPVSWRIHRRRRARPQAKHSVKTRRPASNRICVSRCGGPGAVSLPIQSTSPPDKLGDHTAHINFQT
jgi:hypothetical protein